MQAIAVDSCNYTLAGLAHHLAHINVIFASKISAVRAYCKEHPAGLVFISEDCLAEENEEMQALREMIACNADFIFFIFMSTSRTNFKEHVVVRNNLVFLSKHTELSTFRKLVDDYIQRGSRHPLCNNRHSPPVTLSRKESVMLEMWMSCHSTPHISEELKIKNKTIAAHKGNIKKKIKTNSKQIIHHVFRLAKRVTEGIYVDREKLYEQ